MTDPILQFPEVFLKRLERIIPPQVFEEVLEGLRMPKPVSFRVNSLKNSAGDVWARLGSQGFILEKIPWCANAFILNDGKLRELQKTEIYETGGIYVQSLSSLIPPIVLSPQPGETVLDLTAAPGSKTTQMSAMMNGQGKILANDNQRARFFKLKANVQQQGAANVELSLRYGEIFGRKFPENFDRVLLDAPCSAEGRFDPHDPASYRYWKSAKIKEMTRKQKRLIFSAMHALRPGGTLVYSTCTFAPEENEGVLDWLLEKLGDSIRLDEIDLAIPNRSPGILQWENRSYHPAVGNAIRILPTRQMEGFFVAKILKNKSLPVYHDGNI